MSKKAFYKYDPETDTYYRYERTKKQKIFIRARRFVWWILICSFFLAFIFFITGTPSERKTHKEKEMLLIQYDILSRRLDEAISVLNDLQQRDENLYRVILQGEPIPSQSRNASFENIMRYKDLLSLEDADLVVSTSKKMDLLRRQLYIQSNSLEEIVDLCKTHEDKIKRLPAIQPIANKDLKKTASGYGWRIDPIYQTRRFHQGMDFSAAIGTPIYCTGDGIVKKSGWQQGYGITIEVDHGYGYITRYAHLSKSLVSRGDKITRTQEIGLVGNTGKSTGPHLHYEVLFNGRHQNPMNYYFLDLTPEEYDNMLQISENHGQVMD